MIKIVVAVEFLPNKRPSSPGADSDLESIQSHKAFYTLLKIFQRNYRVTGKESGNGTNRTGLLGRSGMKSKLFSKEDFTHTERSSSAEVSHPIARVG